MRLRAAFMLKFMLLLSWDRGSLDSLPEPFAVFHDYRHMAKLIPESRHPLSVLVVDFGGGTFDCCIIETTEEGNLARNGSTAVPLGVKSVEGAGKELIGVCWLAPSPRSMTYAQRKSISKVASLRDQETS